MRLLSNVATVFDQATAKKEMETQKDKKKLEEGHVAKKSVQGVKPETIAQSKE